MDALFTPDDVAEKLSVTPKTVRDWLRSGELIGIKVGKGWRIHPKDLTRLLDEQLFKARFERAARLHPDVTWARGQCRECGELMPEPQTRDHWVCSPDCKVEYDAKAAAVVGRGTEEFATCCASVVPPI